MCVMRGYGAPYGDHVPEMWLGELPGVDKGETTNAVAKYVVTITQSLYDHASSCLRKGDVYGMEVTYILLGYTQDR